MINIFELSIAIQLNPDPVTAFTRRLVSPCIFIDTINRKIDITWHMEHITPTGVVYNTTAHRQLADNNTLVNIATQEHLTPEQYEAMENKPAVMGEFDFWCMANSQSPFPVLAQVEAYGQVFAQRNGWV